MTVQKTTVDWLRFRVQAEPRDIIKTLGPMFENVNIGEPKLKPLDRGMLGFKQASQIMLADMPLGRMDYGGESQKGWVRVDLSGKGCEWVTNWDKVSEVEALQSAQLRRLDIALTTWAGEVTHEQVVQAHTNGRFTIRRPPKLQQIISSDPRQGRTCYIGEREKADKFMRCYEKGLEIAGKYEGKTPGIITHIEGSKVEDIYRCEVELKASNTDIPWEVIERRDQYFAGAYPFCADILPNVETDILKRRPEREAQLGLAAALENCRIQYGPTLFTALMAYGGDFMAVWDKVVGDHHSQSLIESGVLLVEHE
jgi:phage replication initiation protein